MAPKRRREQDYSASSLASPNYLRSGLLIDPSASSAPHVGPQRMDMDSIIESIGEPSKNSGNAAPLKWVIDGAVLPQGVLQHALEHGTLPLRCCELLCGTDMEALCIALGSKRVQDIAVEVFPRKLSMLVTKDGKVLHMQDAGLRPTNEVAVLNLSTVQSAILVGRDRDAVDVPIDHPSCSGQHAVMASRMVYDKTYGEGLLDTVNDETFDESLLSDLFDVTVFIKDLRSTHGTRLNGALLTPNVWTALKASDRLVFGLSSREYVIVESSTLS